jgi:hypothetical protein
MGMHHTQQERTHCCVFMHTFLKPAGEYVPDVCFEGSGPEEAHDKGKGWEEELMDNDKLVLFDDEAKEAVDGDQSDEWDSF